jgi:hypothetical protein
MDMRKHTVIIALIVLALVAYGIAAEHTKTDTIVKEATVAGTVTGRDNSTLVAQLVFKGDDVSVRINTDILGRYEIVLPLGEYRCEITKGSEYERKTVSIDVMDRRAKYIEPIMLKKLYDTQWIAGDLHQHSVYSFDAKDSPADILVSDLSAGLRFGVITDHNEIRANAEFMNASLEGFIPLAGIEITTDRGHYNAIRFDSVVDSDVSDGAADIRRIVREVRKDDDAYLQVNHPLRNDQFDFQAWEMIGAFDGFEVWNGKSMPPYVEGEPNYKSLHKWYELLNERIYLPATAGSDNHDISGNKMFTADTYKSDDERYFMTNMYSGSPRTYIYTEGTSPQDVLTAVRKGNSFLTNNPLAFLDIDGMIPGESAPAGRRDIHILIQSNREITSYRIIKNGAVLYEENAAELTVEDSVAADLEEGDWVVLEVMGEKGDYAMTNPVFMK